MRNYRIFFLFLFIFTFASAANLIHWGVLAQTNGQTPHPHQFGAPIYHHHPPEEDLPPTLNADQFRDQRPAYVAYTLAAQIKDVLYQAPCYCACNRTQGHRSLLDCFTGNHGASCPICQKEAIFCFLQHRQKKELKQIREGLAKDAANKIDLENPDAYLREREPSPK
jgi:Protein of unknown function with PCYCGC motif